jgi:HemX protein
VLYLGASGTLAASFAGGRGVAPRTGAAMTGGAVILHGAGLVAFTAQYAELPLVGLAPSLCTLAFLIAVFLFARRWRASRGRSASCWCRSSPCCSPSRWCSASRRRQPLAFRGVWFSLHVLLAFIGYAGLAVAFAAGLLYLLQFRELKDKRLGRVFRFFPSLPCSTRWAGAGLPSASRADAGAAARLGVDGPLPPDVRRDDPQVIWGVLTWLAFAAVLGRAPAAAADTERRAALASVVGFVVRRRVLPRAARVHGRRPGVPVSRRRGAR